MTLLEAMEKARKLNCELYRTVYVVCWQGSYFATLHVLPEDKRVCRVQFGKLVA